MTEVAEEWCKKNTNLSINKLGLILYLFLSLHRVYLHLGLLPSQSDVEDIQNLLQILVETDSSQQIKSRQIHL